MVECPNSEERLWSTEIMNNHHILSRMGRNPFEIVLKINRHKLSCTDFQHADNIISGLLAFIGDV